MTGELPFSERLHPDSGSPPFQTIEGETVHSIERLTMRRPDRLEDLGHALSRLCDVSRLVDVGARGPAVASRSSAENVDVDELHLFEALYARDAVLMARFAGPYLPRPTDRHVSLDILSDATVYELASYMGLPFDRSPDNHDYVARLEAPGMIPHEVRDNPNDPVTRRLIADQWRFPCFQSDDATGLWLERAAGMMRADFRCAETTIVRRDGSESTLAECAGEAAKWIFDRLEPSGGGALIFSSRAPHNPVFPTYKDSRDAYSRRDGSYPTGNVAVLDVQIYAYEALRACAELVRERPEMSAVMGFGAQSFTAGADLMKSAVTRTFVVRRSSEIYLAPGLERTPVGNVALDVKASNMGQVLNTDLLDGRASVVDGIVRQLMDPRGDLLAPAGIRTLGKSEVQYGPGRYHNGQVWLWENLHIANGLDRHGYHGLAWELRARVSETCNALNRWPEFVRGDADVWPPRINERVVDVHSTQMEALDPRKPINRVEQPPQEVQGWTVAAMIEVEAKVRAARVGALNAPRVLATQPRQRALESELLALIDQRGERRFPGSSLDWQARNHTI